MSSLCLDVYTRLYRPPPFGGNVVADDIIDRAVVGEFLTF